MMAERTQAFIKTHYTFLKKFLNLKNILGSSDSCLAEIIKHNHISQEQKNNPLFMSCLKKCLKFELSKIRANVVQFIKRGFRESKDPRAVLDSISSYMCMDVQKNYGRSEFFLILKTFHFCQTNVRFPLNSAVAEMSSFELLTTNEQTLKLNTLMSQHLTNWSSVKTLAPPN